MKKITNLLRTGFAATAIFALGASSAYAAYPEGSDLKGSYALSSQFTLADESYKDKVSGSFEFSIAPMDFVTSYSNDIYDFVFKGSIIPYSYNANTGVVTVQNYVQFSGSYYCFVLGDAEDFPGRKDNWSSPFQFTFSESGELTVPSFKLYTLDWGNDKPADLIATYENVKIGDDGAGGDDGGSYLTNEECYQKFVNTTHSFKGTLTRVNFDPKYDARFEALKEAFDFKFVDYYGNLALSDFILLGTKNLAYDENTGELKVSGNSGSINGLAGNVGFSNIEGQWSGLGALYTKFIWQIGPDGSITIPDFSLVDITDYSQSAGSGQVMFAKYTNISVDGEGGSGDGGDEGDGGDDNPGYGDSYPTLEQILKEYPFSGTFTPGPGTTDLVFTDNSKFTVKTAGTTNFISDFLGYFTPYINYDPETGLLTFTNYYYSGNGTYIAFAPEGSTYDTSNKMATPKLTIQFGKDGSVTMPNFNLYNWQTGEQVGSYTNIKIIEPTVSVSYPTLDELLGDTFAFSSTFSQPGTSAYTFEGSFDFTVFKDAYGNTVLNGFLGNGFNPRFTYVAETGKLSFFASYFGTSADGYVVVVPEGSTFNGMKTDKLVIQVNSDGTMTVPSFTVNDFNTGNVIASYSAITVGQPSYPALSSLAGQYQFSSNIEFTDNATAALKNLLGEKFVFTINPSSDKAGNISDFLYSGNSSAMEYNQETGVLTYSNVYSNPAGVGNIYYAPGGNYTGFSGDAANRLKFQVGFDGTLTLTDFSVGTCEKLSGPFTSSANYTNIVIKAMSAEDSESFVGTFNVFGTTYSYENGVLDETSTGELTLTINEKGQLVSLGDYQLPEQELEWNYNQGKVKGNQWILDCSAYTGFDYEHDTSDPEQTATNNMLFSNTSGSYNREYELILTKEEDGTYSLTPFTLWWKTETVVEQDNMKSVTRNYTLVCKWEPGEAQDVVEFAGTWPVKGTYTSYNNGEPTIESNGDFDLIINGNNVLVSIAGQSIDEWDISDGRNQGNAKGNVLTWEPGFDLGLNWESNPQTLLGGPSTESYTASGNITFTVKSEDNYQLSGFTIWSREIVNMSPVYTLIKSWTPGEGDGGGGDDQPVTFEGIYTMKGKYYNYVETGASTFALDNVEDAEFILEINDNNQPVQFAGFTMDEWSVADGENLGQVDGNQLVWEVGFPDGMRFLDPADDITYYYIGGESTEEYTPGDTVVFTKTGDDAYSLTPFTIWLRTVVNSTPSYTLLKKWDASVGTGVEDIVIEKVTPEYYDLQGRKVVNPERGIYIMKAGKTVKKILK